MEERVDESQLATPKISLPDLNHGRAGLPEAYLEALPKETRELAVSVHRIAVRTDWLCDKLVFENQFARQREARVIRLERAAQEQATFRAMLTIKIGVFATVGGILVQIGIMLISKMIK